MKGRVVSKYLGLFILSIALLMLPSALWAVYFKEWRALVSFLEAIAAAVALGALFLVIGWRAGKTIYQREGLGLVGIGWLMAAGIGALPYVMHGALSPVDAFFESMSGFTTTGSTVITDIESWPRSMLFWRSFTHWLGGMGIIVLFIAVLPFLGAGGKQLFKSESPGPDPRGLRPRIKDTASILWKIYFGLTIAQTLLLMICGMSFYEALCHTFGTLATGGFSTRQASIAAFDSLSIELVIIVFMVVAGTNFGLYFAMLRGRWLAPFKSTEWRIYALLLVFATGFVTLNLISVQGWAPVVPSGTPAHWAEVDANGGGDTSNDAAEKAGAGAPGQFPGYTPGKALRRGAFQVVSIMTTTGYCTDDFNRWPYFSRMFLVILMFVGGCAGSTGGGMKVVRLILLFKLVYRRLEATFRPKTIRAIRISNTVVDVPIQNTVYAFFVLHIFIFAAGIVVMSGLGLPFETAFTSVAATLNNIGPGLELVGAVQDYHLIPGAGKLLLALFMVMGRLELFSICVLFLPAFWRHA